MPREITPSPIPVATHQEIGAFEINAQSLIGTVAYSEGYYEGEAFVKLRDQVHHIDQAQLGALMSQPGDPDRTLYEQIKDLLYGLLAPVPPAEPEPEPEPSPEE